MEEEKIKSKHGGARPGAGRKRKVKNTDTYKRVKVKSQHYDLIRVLINMVENIPEDINLKRGNTPCMLDNSLPIEKECGLHKWKEYDAIKSISGLSIFQRYNYKLFALAWLIVKPSGITLTSLKEKKFQILWNRYDQFINLMAIYGYLLGLGESNILECHRELYNQIPNTEDEIFVMIQNL